MPDPTSTSAASISTIHPQPLPQPAHNGTLAHPLWHTQLTHLHSRSSLRASSPALAASSHGPFAQTTRLTSRPSVLSTAPPSSHDTNGHPTNRPSKATSANAVAAQIQDRLELPRPDARPDGAVVRCPHLVNPHQTYSTDCFQGIYGGRSCLWSPIADTRDCTAA